MREETDKLRTREMEIDMLTLLLLLLILLTMNACVARPDESPFPKGIIDMHVHVAGIGAGGSGCYVSPDLRKNWRYRTYLKAFGVSQEELSVRGDAVVFEKISAKIDASDHVAGAVILALDGVVASDGELDLSQTEIYIPNDFVLRETSGYANLYYGASVNPYRHDAIERLEKAAADGAVLIKWLPAIQQIDPADEALIPFYRKLVELDLPLLTHAGHELSFTRADAQLGDPDRLRLPLSLGVRVIAAHAASTGKTDGEDNMIRLIRMFPEYPNLYADISSLTQLNKLRYLPRLLAHKEVQERLIYGTDFPLINTALVSPWFYPARVPFAQALKISRNSNPWDRDVLLKRDLRVPVAVFARSAQLLRINLNHGE